MLRIIHKQPECIGCDLCCQVAPDYWFMNDDGMAELRAVLKIKGTLTHGAGWDQDEEQLKEAEEGCPVNIIRIEG